ncbi:unnamed protein product [Effrenium voratum]|uniref:J domain-containing protein n=1 Tax=Effrenium voratum TaxID=2562239 RepID=A0AA36NKW9_9DINO|nr:unnamed protein product [Effrenium voratum]
MAMAARAEAQGPQGWLALALLWSCLTPAQGFFEELFGGGGGGIHFEMGGGRRGPEPVQWPPGVSDEASKTMSWLKGTEWQWNNDGFTLKLSRDGDIDAPIQQCQRGCKWTAEKGKLYLSIGSAGIFELNAPDPKPARMEGQRLKGFSRRNSRERLTLTFHRIYDHEAVDLDKDLYEVLGIPEDADEATIKKVYRKLSIQYHPDKNPDEASKARFAEVRDAYEILNDPDKKILYDTGGMGAVKDSEKGKIESTGDLNSEIEVGLEDFYLGNQFQAMVKRGIVCRGCRKHPDSPNCKGCGRCKNQIKVVQVQMGPFLTQQQQEVPSKEKCKQVDAPLDVHIEKGMSSGDSLTFPRMAEERPGMLPGSVILKLKARKHPKFQRNGNDLHTDLTISLKESLLGWTRTLTHLDGHAVEVKQIDFTTRHLQVVKVRGEGMPLRDDPASFGDLHVKVSVDFPKQLTREQRDAIAQVFPDGRQDL